jgi:hypothetical protein
VKRLSLRGRGIGREGLLNQDEYCVRLTIQLEVSPIVLDTRKLARLSGDVPEHFH